MGAVEVGPRDGSLLLGKTVGGAVVGSCEGLSLHVMSSLLIPSHCSSSKTT